MTLVDMTTELTPILIGLYIALAVSAAAIAAEAIVSSRPQMLRLDWRSLLLRRPVLVR